MRYYSAKADVLVTRYGTGSYIGATVEIAKDGERKGQTEISHDEELVVAITDAEFAKYAREYLQLEREGSLIKRTEADYKAQLQVEEAKSKKEAEAIEAANKKAEEESKAAEKKETADREAAEKKAKPKPDSKS